MKQIQPDIKDYLNTHKRHKRYIAFSLVMSLIVSLIVQFNLISPAISMTDDSSRAADVQMLENHAGADGNIKGDIIYSPKERSAVELLVGDGVEWAGDCTNASEVAELAKDEYFLGIAYDFSLFLKENATLTDADAEGRVAVGGNLVFTGGYCYQVGSGNFGYMTALKDTDDYKGITNFAHAIVGGYMKNIHPLSTGDNQARVSEIVEKKGGHQSDGKTLYFPPTEDEFKRFVVGDVKNENFTHPWCAGGEKYSTNGSHDSVAVNELAEMYHQPEGNLIDFNSTFEWLIERSKLLGEKTATGTTTTSGNNITFTIPESMQNAKTVYFDLPDNVNYSSLDSITFVNVPKETTEMVVRETKTDELKTITKNIPKCNLIINGKGFENFNIRGTGNTTKTYIQYTGESTAEEISNSRDDNRRDEFNNDSYYNNSNGDVKGWRSNNHPASSKILYNFPDATGDCTINGNFNGTILAPKADVKSDEKPCSGHLSGALIANSFSGGIEFGYRPYRGTSDILGAVSGYTVPFNKFDVDNNFLSGAKFELIDSSTDKSVESWNTGNGTEYIQIPSAVDYKGRTVYNEDNKIITKTYIVQEKSAPNGYIKTSKTYKLEVKETVDLSSLIITTDNHTIPTKVDVEIKLFENDSTEALRTINLSVADEYIKNENEEDVLSQRVITIINDVNDVNSNEYFILNFDKNEKIESVSQPVNKADMLGTESDNTENTEVDIVDNAEPVENTEVDVVDNAEPKAVNRTIETKTVDITNINSSEVIIVDESRYYYDPDSMMITPLPSEDSVPSFINEYGLVFKKVDENGSLLSGADISLQSGINGKFTNVESPEWVWDTNSDSYTISVKDISEGTVYRFHENTPPMGYEVAKDVYFKKTGTLIIYTDNPALDESSWNQINIANNERVISMTDYKIHGEKVKLKKVDSSGKSLDGSEFKLFAKNRSGENVAVYPANENPNDTIKVENGEINLYDFFNSLDKSKYNTEYVKNGYLMPGTYALVETKAPDKYQAPNGEFCFKIEDNGAGGFNMEKIVYVKPTYLEMPSDKLGSDSVYEFGSEYNNAPITRIEVDVSAVSSDARAIQFKPTGDNSVKEVSLQEGTNSIETDFSFGANGRMKITYWNCTITAIRFYSEPAKPDKVIIGNKITMTPASSYLEMPSDKLNSGSESYLGSEYSNVKITKIEVDVSNVNGDSHEIQFKPNGDNGANKQLALNTGTNVFDNINDLSFGSNGYMKITHWNCTITAIRFYPEGVSSSTDKPDLKIKKLTAYYFDGTTDELLNIEASGSNGDASFPFDISELENKEVVGLKLELLGNGIGCLSVGDWKLDNVKAGTYTVGETSGTNYNGEDVAADDVSNLITVNDGTISIQNDKAGSNTSITVMKNWVDTGFESSRPEKIKVQLYQSTSADGTDEIAYGNPVELTAENNWKYTWNRLPAYPDGQSADDDDAKPYYYTAKEVEVPVGYEKTDAAWNTSGTVTITNTLKTINITAKKEWNIPKSKTVTKPEISIGLQRKNGENWEDVSGFTAIVLNSGNSWTYEFTGIPEGTYRIKENRVPTGWTAENRGISDETSENDATLTITNTLQTGSLNVTKNWTDDNANDRPANVKVKIYRTTEQPGAIPPSDTKYATVTEDYARLLQYSLYFYDANECGNDVDDNILSWRNNCHTNDDVLGGYHDAGDHVMFGLPQGFTSSTLGWTYYEYKDTFEKLGLTAHYKDIMDRFCDFYKRSTTMDSNGSVTNLLIEKGEGNDDHNNYWGPPENQNRNQKKYASKENGGSNIAADYAATLAQYYLNFSNDSKANEYLKYAKALYAYAKDLNKPYSVDSFYYDNSCTEELAWGAAWLALATGETQYSTECKQYLDNFHANRHTFDTRGHFWGEPALGAEIVYNSYLTNSPDWSNIDSYLNTNCTGDGFRQLNKWGTTRHNTLLQLCALTTDKHKGTEEYRDWCKGQMSYILGENHFNNNNGVCFVVGFNSNSPKAPHHEAASGCDNWNEYGDYKDNNKSCDHTLVGALVGGPHNNTDSGAFSEENNNFTYEDNINNSVDNEVALDYNAGLVGAAAALYDAYGTGYTVSEAVMIADGLELKDGKHIYEAQAKAKSITPSANMLVPEKIQILSDSETENVPVAQSAGSPVIVNGSDYKQDGDVTIPVPSSLYGFEITSIEVIFDKTTGNGTVQLDPWLNGKTNQYDYDLSKGSTFSFSPKRTVNDKDLTNIIIKKYWDNGQKVKEVKFYYDAGDSFTVTPSQSELVVGDTLTLTASGYDTSVSWSSGDESVATVDENGKVTAIKAGTATITGTDNEGKTGECTINISDLQINKSNVTLTVDGTDTLAVNGQTEGHTFEWKSSNVSVVTVDGNGNITAVGAGDATITLTKDGNYTATCNIHVNKKPFSISVNPTNVKVGGTATLTAENTDGGTVTYTSSDESVATIEGNTIHAIAPGTVTITGTLGNETATCTFTVNDKLMIMFGDEAITRKSIGRYDTLQLSTNSSDGTVIWESGNKKVATVDQNGLVTPVGFGTTVITAKASDGDKAECIIEVGAAIPDIPANKEFVKTVELNSGNDWKATVGGLDIYDANGNPYVYYIVEVNENDEPATSIQGNNGAVYVPVSYNGNGVQLDSNETKNASVTNEFKEKNKTAPTLPMTGGTGTIPYYVFGGCLITLSGVTLLARKKVRKDK